MWKNNRPDGWDKVVRENHEIHFENHNWNKTFEAGADALWEALMKHRVKMPPDFTPILIVIPEEK